MIANTPTIHCTHFHVLLHLVEIGILLEISFVFVGYRNVFDLIYLWNASQGLLKRGGNVIA